LPALKALAYLRPLGVGNAIVGRFGANLSIAQLIEKASMPSLGRAQTHLEADPSIRVDGRRVVPLDCNRQFAAEILIAIDGPQGWRVLAPLRRYPATADHIPRFNLEQIGEVASDQYFQIEANRLHPVVHQINIFVQSAIDRTADGQLERMRRNTALFGRDVGIGQEYARGKMEKITAVEKLPRQAIRVDHPVADQSRVKEKQPQCRGKWNLPVPIRDQHAVSLVDRDLRGAYCDLKSQVFNLFVPRSSSE
jgi:hypothetical protein